MFNEFGILIIEGAKGALEEVLKEFAAGNLKSSEEVCHEHMHHHDQEH